MIEKIYQVQCDECGIIIGYYEDEPNEKILKNDGIKVIKRGGTIIHTYCEDCGKLLSQIENIGGEPYYLV